MINLGKANTDNEPDNESDMASIYSSGSCDVDSVIENNEMSSNEKYEEKMLQLIENCAEKSIKVRVPALKSMCEIMQHRYFMDFIIERKITIVDIIEKSLRRGKIEEQELAAKLLILFILQIGGEHNDFKTVCQILSTVISNSTCLQSLAMFFFLTSEDIGEIINVMIQFEQIFIRTETSTPSASEDLVQLNVEAMRGWGILMTRIPPGDFCSYVKNGTILK